MWPQVTSNQRPATAILSWHSFLVCFGLVCALDMQFQAGCLWVLILQILFVVILVNSCSFEIFYFHVVAGSDC